MGLCHFMKTMKSACPAWLISPDRLPGIPQHNCSQDASVLRGNILSLLGSPHILLCEVPSFCIPGKMSLLGVPTNQLYLAFAPFPGRTLPSSVSPMPGIMISSSLRMSGASVFHCGL